MASSTPPLGGGVPLGPGQEGTPKRTPPVDFDKSPMAQSKQQAETTQFLTKVVGSIDDFKEPVAEILAAFADNNIWGLTILCNY